MSIFSDPELEKLSFKIQEAKAKQLRLELVEAQAEITQLKAERQRALDILISVLETPPNHGVAMKALIRRAFPELNG